MSLVVIVSGAGEIDQRMDERMRQWMLYTSSQRCATLVLFRVFVRAFFGCFSFRSQRVERSRLRQLTANRLSQSITTDLAFGRKLNNFGINTFHTKIL